MSLSIAINGFGRIGRCILRAAQARDDVHVAAINDLAPAPALAHMFEFDSVHGRYPGPVRLDGDTLDVGGGPIRITSERDPSALPWQGIDIALECTGHFRTDDAAAQHVTDKVLISAPGQGSAPTVVYGVNHDTLTGADRIVSNGSCTTNCLAPVAQVLHSNFTIIRGTMTTVHSYTATQPTHDRAGGDLARDRAAAMSMVPTSTGAAAAIEKVLPELSGRLFGTSIRVPVPNVSCIDMTVELGRDVSTQHINDAFQHSEKNDLQGVLETETRPLVSRDYLGTAASATVQLNETAVVGKRMARVLAWYDNEWAFSHRMLDVAAHMQRL